MGLTPVISHVWPGPETQPPRCSVLSSAAQVHSASFLTSSIFYGQDSKSPFQTARSKLLASSSFRMYLAGGVRVVMDT